MYIIFKQLKQNLNQGLLAPAYNTVHFFKALITMKGLILKTNWDFFFPCKFGNELKLLPGVKAESSSHLQDQQPTLPDATKPLISSSEFGHI